jgi:L-2-hydroxyglutarate oxidase LhgO
MKTYDTIVIGGGIVGLAIARELLSRDPNQRIAIFEKEPELGRHASGRNSGVLHSGIYYPPASLKGRLCTEGARLMREYCDERKLPIARIGKVIVPASEAEDGQLEVLLERATANGARAEIVNAADYEPEARDGRALFSPDTSVVDPKRILTGVAGELRAAGVEFVFNRDVTEVDRGTYGFLVNAAGLHADRIARPFGVGERYTILPFRGRYYKLAAPFVIRRLIYPVPDLRVPFLGVHFTNAIDGTTYVGPTAMPALGRENYSGLHGIRMGDAVSIATTIVRQYASNRQGFRTLLHQEAARLLKRNYAAAARALVPRLETKHLKPSTKAGIRAQLFDRVKNELVMDFVVERGERSLHILNAVSPGFTTAFSFARFALDFDKVQAA